MPSSLSNMLKDFSESSSDLDSRKSEAVGPAGLIGVLGTPILESSTRPSFSTEALQYNNKAGIAFTASHLRPSMMAAFASMLMVVIIADCVHPAPTSLTLFLLSHYHRHLRRSFITHTK